MPLSALIRRGLLSLLLAVAVTMTPTRPPLAQSADNARYAAIVVDAESGEVLFARHADSRRYPASITKVMTLYLAFEALAEGKGAASVEEADEPAEEVDETSAQLDDAVQRVGRGRRPRGG